MSLNEMNIDGMIDIIFAVYNIIYMTNIESAPTRSLP